jgi:hypothetical protein
MSLRSTDSIHNTHIYLGDNQARQKYCKMTCALVFKNCLNMIYVCIVNEISASESDRVN